MSKAPYATAAIPAAGIHIGRESAGTITKTPAMATNDPKINKRHLQRIASHVVLVPLGGRSVSKPESKVVGMRRSRLRIAIRPTA
jgi:hypothetical protein